MNLSPSLPTLEQIREARATLGDSVMRTPVIEWKTAKKDTLLGKDSSVFLKLELFQPGGSFKLRGALLNIRNLTPEQLAKGVTAVSAGNHAIAVAMASAMAGTHAKVVMPSNANPARVNKCKELGAEVVLVANVAVAFEEVERIKEEEGRVFIHPFEGETTALGTATVGLEFAEQVANLDAVIIPIGGGGLAAGMASALSQLVPGIKLYGVEPFGANSMYLSFLHGSPQKIDKVRSIADSLGAPFAMPYSYGLCRQTLEEVVLIEDRDMKQTIALMFEQFKLALEPAGAASLAALLGPLRQTLAGKRVGCIVCGSNIDSGSFFSLLEET
ncbi:MAG: pyridoxal-phosphate dependent enzyme [Bacteroidia bacterium]|nr:pyridoxal-phosphate dependent enzyme [Bacteroidia bacterium]